MSTLTIRLPDEKYKRLKSLAERHRISVNKLINELATIALANYDAQIRFESRAQQGNAQRSVDLLNKLGNE